MKQAPLIVVIYDGINNSVFDSQVMQPLIKSLKTHTYQKIVLVSFEKNHPTSQSIQKKIPHHPSLTFIACKKLPYIGIASLYFAVYTLKKILKKYAHYDLQARGPFAGFICQKACQPSSCDSLTIQARGLLAQEYAYEHPTQSHSLVALWHTFRYRQFARLEHFTYAKSATRTPFPTTIEAVSDALGEYLVATYAADRTHITTATHDIPDTIDTQQLVLWKKQTRNELEIPKNAIVYCYNGSIKPWQCPEQVITYFIGQYRENPLAILYILTQDKAQFESLIKKHSLPTQAYRVLTAHHADIYRYLAAADIGIMFREPHIVNWVSRPTKALEYRAAGLAIDHNNTVSWLREKTEKNNFGLHTNEPALTEQKIPWQESMRMSI